MNKSPEGIFAGHVRTSLAPRLMRSAWVAPLLLQGPCKRRAPIQGASDGALQGDLAALWDYGG